MTHLHDYHPDPDTLPVPPERQVLADILGIDQPDDPRAVLRQLESGLPGAVVPRLAKRLGTPAADLFTLLDIPPSGRDHAGGEGRRLTIWESDRTYRIARLLSEATRVLENPDAAATWLRTPHAALAGETPLRMARTDAGTHQVTELLGRIENGIPS